MRNKKLLLLLLVVMAGGAIGLGTWAVQHVSIHAERMSD